MGQTVDVHFLILNLPLKNEQFSSLPPWSARGWRWRGRTSRRSSWPPRAPSRCRGRRSISCCRKGTSKIIKLLERNYDWMSCTISLCCILPAALPWECNKADSWGTKEHKQKCCPITPAVHFKSLEMSQSWRSEPRQLIPLTSNQVRVMKFFFGQWTAIVPSVKLSTSSLIFWVHYHGRYL